MFCPLSVVDTIGFLPSSCVIFSVIGFSLRFLSFLSLSNPFDRKVDVPISTHLFSITLRFPDQREGFLILIIHSKRRCFRIYTLSRNSIRFSCVLSCNFSLSVAAVFSLFPVAHINIPRDSFLWTPFVTLVSNYSFSYHCNRSFFCYINFYVPTVDEDRFFTKCSYFSCDFYFSELTFNFKGSIFLFSPTRNQFFFIFF
ncbi:hypothetical protein BJ742DRAFT_308703 [Cladochytrium replicatum]|nr:hypothetical protein BJ742DRAFT_308703 [Cladochytrium replicatum]